MTAHAYWISQILIFSSNGIQYGLLAQDIQKVFPQLVVQDSNGYLQTSYSTFDPMILEGIRYIDQEINSMEKEINDLLFRMDSIESTLKFETKEFSIMKQDKKIRENPYLSAGTASNPCHPRSITTSESPLAALTKD